jgi:hypothetical protein
MGIKKWGGRMKAKQLEALQALDHCLFQFTI